MANGNFVSYLRVSTARQGQSGPGLQAQRKSVDEFLNGGKWDVIKEFVATFPRELYCAGNACRPAPGLARPSAL